jgi:hypothetical protein
MQEITLLNVKEDQNIDESVRNDEMEQNCRKNYLKYVKMASGPSYTQFSVCTRIKTWLMCSISKAIKFQNFPTGYLEENKESMKKENSKYGVRLGENLAQHVTLLYTLFYRSNINWLT